MFEVIFYLESIFILLLLVKIFAFTKWLNFTKFIYKSIREILLMYIKFFSVILICVIGFAALCILIWKKSLTENINEFNSLGLGIMWIFMFTGGYYNIGIKLDVSLMTFFLFFITFFIFQVFFFLAVFAGLFSESLRRSVVKYGYPEDDGSINITGMSSINIKEKIMENT